MNEEETAALNELYAWWENAEAGYQQRIEAQKQLLSRDERIRIVVRQHLLNSDDISPEQYNIILDMWVETK